MTCPTPLIVPGSLRHLPPPLVLPHVGRTDGRVNASLARVADIIHEGSAAPEALAAKFQKFTFLLGCDAQEELAALVGQPGSVDLDAVGAYVHRYHGYANSVRWWHTQT